MAFFDTIERLYNAARGTIPFGKSASTGLPVPLEVSASGRLLVDADIAAGGALATEATLAAADAKLTTITGHVDGVESLLGGGTEVAFGVVQTWTNQTAMTEPPSAWITVQQLGAIEILFAAGMTFGGTVAATQVRFRVWARNSEGGTPRTFKVDEFIVPAATLALTEATNPLLAKRYNIQTNEMAVTVTFIDGTAPTITGDVVVRPIAQQARDDSTIRRDLTSGYQLVQDLSYDALLGANKQARINDLWPASDQSNVVSESSLASGSTYYWPSSSGIAMQNYDDLAIRFSITGATTSATSTTIQGTLDDTNWDDITLNVKDLVVGGTLSGAITTTGGGNVAKLLQISGCNVKAVRVATAVTTAATGAVSASFREAKMGAD